MGPAVLKNFATIVPSSSFERPNVGRKNEKGHILRQKSMCPLLFTVSLILSTFLQLRHEAHQIGRTNQQDDDRTTL